MIYKSKTILFYLFAFIALQNCKETPHWSPSNKSTASKSNSSPGPELSEFTKIKNNPPEAKLSINNHMPSSLSDWSALTDLTKAITDISDGKYQLFEDTEEALKSLFSNLESDIPNTLNTPSILARFKVLETLAYLLKTEYGIDQNNSIEFEPAKESLVEAYSNLMFQVSKTLEKESQHISKTK